jgi:chemotaxis protein methyltransferase WspC
MSRYDDLEEFLSRTIGLEPEAIGRNAIRSEVDALLKEGRTKDRDLYLKQLVSVPEEMEKLIERVVVPETWFFRDREAFRFLKHHVKEGLSQGGRESLNILSVPCSTGEEPYSIAMTLLEAGVPQEMIRVDGVDVSSRAIRVARSGRYGAPSFRGETRSYHERYFTPVEGGMQINASVSSLVHFFQENLMGPDFMSGHGPYRMIFCKNLLIYLTASARQIMFANLDRLLLPGGILFTGHSELTSFLQWDYVPVKHARSFACIKPLGARPAVADHTLNARAGRTKVRPPLLKTGREKLPPPSLANVNIPGTDGGEVRERKRAESPLSAIRRLADKGALDEACRMCECYLEENSANKEGYYLMGLISQALNRMDRAESFFIKALYLDPSYYDALLHMSLLCSQRGDQVKAAIFRERIKRIEETENGRGERA